MQDITVAGHIAVDEVITEEGCFHQLGGPPCFSASISKILGFNVDTVTKIGEDFPIEYKPMLNELGINTARSIGYQSTRFVLDYRYNPRRMKLPTICEPIKPEEVSKATRLLCCPIAGEISDQLMLEVDAGFLALDPQGLLRHPEEDSTVSPKTWWTPEVLKKLDLLKTSYIEHHLITGTSDIKASLKRLIENGVRVAVITDGSNGSYLMHGSEILHVPVFSVDVVDPTGAGDVFIASMAAFIDEGVSWAAAVASASSSALVETRGVRINRSKQENMKRAETVYDKIKRL